MLYNSRNNVIKAFEDNFFSFKDGFQKEEPDVPDETLPYWVRVENKRFNTIKNNVKRVKINLLYQKGVVFAFPLTIRFN